MERAESNRQKHWKARADEAAGLIQKLVDAGVTPEKISESTGVSFRTVYRWWKEGHSPHPILLDALRKLALKKGIDNEVHSEGQH